MKYSVQIDAALDAMVFEVSGYIMARVQPVATGWQKVAGGGRRGRACQFSIYVDGLTM